MCSICGGGACLGTSGCEMIVRTVPEATRVSLVYAQSYLGTMQNYFSNLLLVLHEHIKGFKTHFGLLLKM